MKFVYCSNCGTKLLIGRKAMPKYNCIIDIVEYHTCPDKPVEFDMEINPTQTFMPTEGKDEFVRKLNELQPEPPPAIFDDSLLDKRKSEFIKDTSAPDRILDVLRGMKE